MEEIERQRTLLKELRKKEKQCARNLAGKALLVIGHILTNIHSEDALLSKIYRVAHCATGVCPNEHEDWVKEVHETYTELTK